MKSKPYAYLFGCSLIERCRFFFFFGALDLVWGTSNESEPLIYHIYK